MTYVEAMAMTTYKNYCNCGGYSGMSERAKSEHPHMHWCSQFQEYEERKAAIDRGPNG